MATGSNNHRSRPQAGVTLIELVVAMVIAGIVISLTLASWTFISKHTTLGQHKTEFLSQTEQTASLIVNSIRRSEQVISFDKNAISFIAGIGGDTVTYAFDGDTLRKNGAPVQFVTEGARVVRFSVEKDEAASMPSARPLASAQSAQSAQDAQDIVLTITLGMKDRTGAASEIPSSVKIRLVPPTDPYNKSRFTF
jgi:prepilin-type N-terminal cleavage/methylation domain-containing protein